MCVHLYSDHEVLGLRTIPLLKSTVLHHGDGNSLGIGSFSIISHPYRMSNVEYEYCSFYKGEITVGLAPWITLGIL